MTRVTAICSGRLGQTARVCAGWLAAFVPFTILYTLAARLDTIAFSVSYILYLSAASAVLADSVGAAGRVIRRADFAVLPQT